MRTKNHYKTLELPVSASAAEIKKAYRRLARHYHPDKNDDEERATRFFQEIQAAYEVLSDPARRKAYDRTLLQDGGYITSVKDEAHNPELIVRQTKSLLQYLNTMDQRALNYDALTDFILGIISSDNVALLRRADHMEYNETITRNLLTASKGIQATRAFGEIAARLHELNPKEHNAVLYQLVADELELRKQKEKENQRVPYAALGIVGLVILIMCLIIFLR